MASHEQPYFPQLLFSASTMQDGRPLRLSVCTLCKDDIRTGLSEALISPTGCKTGKAPSLSGFARAAALQGVSTFNQTPLVTKQCVHLCKGQPPHLFLAYGLEAALFLYRVWSPRASQVLPIPSPHLIAPGTCPAAALLFTRNLFPLSTYFFRVNKWQLLLARPLSRPLQRTTKLVLTSSKGDNIQSSP